MFFDKLASIGEWCNGSTSVFGALCRGSNPCSLVWFIVYGKSMRYRMHIPALLVNLSDRVIGKGNTVYRLCLCPSAVGATTQMFGLSSGTRLGTTNPDGSVRLTYRL
jgi:hypothetical protein